MNNSPDVEPDLQGVKGMKGYYVRPSRAIEKGGGFFVPGLEGGRIRIFSGIFLTALTLINIIGSEDSLFSQSFSFYCSLFASLFLLGIGALDAIDLDRFGLSSGEEQSSSDFITMLQCSDSVSASLTSKVGVTVSTIVQTCSNINYVIVMTSSEADTKTDESKACALDKVLFEFGNVKLAPLEANSEETRTKLDSVTYKRNIGVTKVEIFTSASFRQSRFSPLLDFITPNLPQSYQSIIVVKDCRGWLWLMTANDNVKTLEESELWLETILYAPFV